MRPIPGRALLEAWNLPTSHQEAVGCHHAPARALCFPTDAAIVHVADIMAHVLDVGSSGEKLIPPLEARAWDLLGLELRPIPVGEFRAKYRTSYRGGLSVTAVRPGSPAAKQGIRAGDVLVGMHIWETVSVDNVSYVLNRRDFKTLTPLKFFILRGNQTLFGYLPVTLATARRP